jgi:RPA family protein
MRGREVAWRVFAGELNDSSLVLTGDEERAPSYVVTPLGAKINRVYVVGVITDMENMGTSEEPLWRARLADPTGTLFISSGQFQPEASLALSKMPVPGFAAIVGKVRVFSPEEGVIYLSIRPEIVKSVPKEQRDVWVLDGCRSLKHRLEAVSEARQMESPTVGELTSLGYGTNLAEGIVAAFEHYGDFPIERYQSMLVDALRYLVPEEGEEVEIPEGESESEEEYYEADEVPAEPPIIGDEEDEEFLDEELTEQEQRVLDIIDELDPEGGNMDWEVLAKTAKKAGLNNDDFETAMEGLLDKGLVYEPMMGKIRKI